MTTTLPCGAGKRRITASHRPPRTSFRLVPALPSSVARLCVNEPSYRLMNRSSATTTAPAQLPRGWRIIPKKNTPAPVHTDMNMNMNMNMSMIKSKSKGKSKSKSKPPHHTANGDSGAESANPNSDLNLNPNLNSASTPASNSKSGATEYKNTNKTTATGFQEATVSKKRHVAEPQPEPEAANEADDGGDEDDKNRDNNETPAAKRPRVLVNNDFINKEESTFALQEKHLQQQQQKQQQEEEEEKKQPQPQSQTQIQSCENKDTDTYKVSKAKEKLTPEERRDRKNARRREARKAKKQQLLLASGGEAATLPGTATAAVDATAQEKGCKLDEGNGKAKATVTNRNAKAKPQAKAQAKAKAKAKGDDDDNDEDGIVRIDLQREPDAAAHERVLKGDTVGVYYVGRAVGRKTPFDMLARGRPLRFTIGQGEVVAGLERGVIGMAVGERRKIVVPPSYGYGSKNMGPELPPNSTLEFEVKLISRCREAEGAA